MTTVSTAPSSQQRAAESALFDRSVEVIRAGQHASGAYVASPSYPTYDYAWLRDGSFCAYAMDVVGQPDSAARFHRWVAATLLRHRGRIESALTAAQARDRLPSMLPTRFTLMGDEESPGGWPNFQLDGYGTWLWAVRDHVCRGGTLDAELSEAAALVAVYLQATADLACYDCWEEHGDQVHTSTTAAVIAGLFAAGELLNDAPARVCADRLRKRLLTDHVEDGVFVKFRGAPAVDGSLLWLALPFNVVDVGCPQIAATAERIGEQLLRPGGGVRRYLGDTFYGGGEWVLLTAWLGWYDTVTGNLGRAAELRRWIEATATPDGHLPEQVGSAAQDPAMVQPWVDRWGPVATPLLWSHAMYLVLVSALDVTVPGAA